MMYNVQFRGSGWPMSLKAIKGGCLNISNQMDYSCLKCVSKRNLSRTRIEKNMKDQILWLTPKHLPGSLSGPGELISLKGPICDVISAIHLGLAMG